MPKPSPHFLYLFFTTLYLFSSLYPTQSITIPTFNGYQVSDLTSTTFAKFNVEATTWTAVGLVSLTKTMVCGLPILGGYGLLLFQGYYQRTYLSVPPHNAIFFQLRLYIIDGWTSTASVHINFDSTTVSSGNLGNYRTSFPTNLCGLFLNDLAGAAVVGQIAHSGTSLTLQVESQISLLPTVASFGVRSISIIFANTSTTVTDSSCFHVFDNTLINPGVNGECQCTIGTYSAPVPGNPGQCLACDSSCADCFGPSASECYACSTGYSWTGSSCIQCDTSCDTCSGPNANQCVTCQSGLWLQWNNTCTATCNSPASFQEVVDDYQQCDIPCLSSQFLLYDDTCVGSCPAPLVQSMSGPSQICSLPCSTAGDFWYWNNTCSPNCDYPFVQSVQNGVDECDLPCTGTDFLYPNSSCISTCPFPYLTRNYDAVLLCKYPCNFTAGEFFATNGTCVQTCAAPNSQRIQDSLRFCDIYSAPASNTTTPLLQQATETITTTGKIASGGIVAVGVASAGSPNALSLASLVKMLQYIRYMNITFPTRLETLLKSQNGSSMSPNIGPHLPNSVQNMFDNYTLSENFDEYGVSSSFIVNYGDSLMTMGIVLILIASLTITSTLTKKLNNKIHTIFVRLKNVAKWNFFLFVFCSNYEGIALFSTFQLRTVHFDSVSSVISLLMCIAVNGLAIFLLGRLLCAIIDIRKTKHRATSPLDAPHSDHAKVNKKWKSISILYTSFKDETFMQQAYMFFFLGRLYLFDLVIGVLYQYPLLQSIILVLMSSGMVLCLLISRPFKERSNLIELLVNEGILLVVNANVFLLALLDYFEKDAPTFRDTTGDVIIFSNVVFNILSVVFLALEIVLSAVKMHKILKNTKGNGLWMKLTLVLFERDGLEIEEEGESKEESHERSSRFNVKNHFLTMKKRRLQVSPLNESNQLDIHNSNIVMDSPSLQGNFLLPQHNSSEKQDSNNILDNSVQLSPTFSAGSRRLSRRFSRQAPSYQITLNKEDKIEFTSLGEIVKKPSSIPASPTKLLKSGTNLMDYPDSLVLNNDSAKERIYNRRSIRTFRKMSRFQCPSLYDDPKDNHEENQGSPVLTLKEVVAEHLKRAAMKRNMSRDEKEDGARKSSDELQVVLSPTLMDIFVKKNTSEGGSL